MTILVEGEVLLAAYKDHQYVVEWQLLKPVWMLALRSLHLFAFHLDCYRIRIPTMEWVFDEIVWNIDHLVANLMVIDDVTKSMDQKHA